MSEFLTVTRCGLRADEVESEGVLMSHETGTLVLALDDGERLEFDAVEFAATLEAVMRPRLVA